jgi:predicted RNA methylase
MKFSSAITFITLAASSVYGNAIDISARDANTAALQDANTLESRATCSNSDMQAVRDRINHYNVFCQAFNAQYVF